MKTAFAALAAALILPATAMAQTQPNQTNPAQTGAAATLPNTFDQPAVQAPPAPAPSAPATPSDPAKVAAAEAALRKTISAFQAGSPNYSDMTPDLAEKVRAQASRVLPMFQQLGALQSVTHVGAQDGAELFAVGFANAPTQWIIAQNAEGKILALLFRPAPASEPAPAPGG